MTFLRNCCILVLNHNYEMVFVDVPCLTSLMQIGHEKQWYVVRERLSSDNNEEIKFLFSNDVFTNVFMGSLTLSHPLFKAQICKSSVLMGAVPHVYNLLRISGKHIYCSRAFLSLIK